MKQINLITLILAMLFIVACKDKSRFFEGEYELTGRVLDEVTGKAIADAGVGIFAHKREFFSQTSPMVGYGYTDGNGIFKIRFPADEKNYNYELMAQENKNYFETSGGKYFSLNNKGKSTEDITLTPYGYLKLHVVGNKGGWTIGGSISSGMGNGGIGRFYKGMDSIRLHTIDPTEECRIYYSVRNSNDEIISQHIDTLPPPQPHDTIYHKIEF